MLHRTTWYAGAIGEPMAHCLGDYPMDYNPRHVPTTLVSVEITKAYVAFYHWTWLPNTLRPLLVIFRKGEIYKAKW